MKYLEKTGGMRFKFGRFYALGDKPVNVAGKMRHGELLNMDYVDKLYNKEV